MNLTPRTSPLEPGPHRSSTGACVVVDGMNVIGARPDGWWRDRDGAARRLLRRLQTLRRATGDEVTLVLDGQPIPDVPEGTHEGVQVIYARRRGRDAGDDRLIEAIEALPDPRNASVVTSDRLLAQRAERLGARVAGVSTLLHRLDRLAE